MESQILRAMERLTHDLSELRAGGRFNPEHLEKLKVTLKPTGSALDGKETHPLGDLAQVIPKGRIITVVAGDEEVRPTPHPPKKVEWIVFEAFSVYAQGRPSFVMCVHVEKAV